MSTAIKLKAQPRQTTGKSVKQLRDEGLTPIVVYGPKVEPVALQTSSKELVRVLSAAGGTQLIAVEVEGEDGPRMTLAKDVQRHVTRLEPIHADFLQVVMDEVLTKNVPVVLQGEAPVARRLEGIVSLMQTQLPVTALPANLPEQIVVDISGLDAIGETVVAASLTTPGGVEIDVEPDLVIVNVEAPRMPTEEEEEAEAEDEELLEELEEGEEPAEAVEEETPPDEA